MNLNRAEIAHSYKRMLLSITLTVFENRKALAPKSFNLTKNEPNFITFKSGIITLFGFKIPYDPRLQLSVILDKISFFCFLMEI
jgi:hypothetical protein